jgi:S-methyl-5-thioribose-1-phosphate isomerase
MWGASGTGLNVRRLANMKVKVNGKAREYRAVWWENGKIKLIDQRLLPHRFSIFSGESLRDAEYAIKEMVVRGAPAIGATAAYAMAQARIAGTDPQTAGNRLKATRPTAYDLFHAVDFMAKAIRNGRNPLQAAEGYADGIVEECEKIGINGSRLLAKKCQIMTHCNAGALATVDFGTALAPIRVAQKQGKRPFVFVSETRPRLQGARLTSWELRNEGIAHAVISDGASGYYMNKGEVDIVITGADRITSCGDAANKIGTYEKAVLAKENGVPFYIAAPMSTFDFSLKSGRSIVIEERAEDEVLVINGKPITASGVRSKNPAFDVTPAKYISGFITKYGIVKPGDISRRLGKKKICG